MKIHYPSYSVGGYLPDGTMCADLVVERWPLWAAVLDTLVCHWGCALTQHRFCNSRLMRFVDRLTWPHIERFSTQVSRDELARYVLWRHGEEHPWFLDDDEED